MQPSPEGETKVRVSRWSFFGFSAVAGVIAAAAAWVSLLLALPVWAMFAGWVAFFTRGATTRDGVYNLASLLGGIVFGIVAAVAVELLTPSFGTAALPAVVFVVSIAVLSLRILPRINNILCYFLGLIVYFAANLQPSVDTFLTLAISVSLGSVAGWCAHSLQRKFV